MITLGIIILAVTLAIVLAAILGAIGLVVGVIVSVFGLFIALGSMAWWVVKIVLKIALGLFIENL